MTERPERYPTTDETAALTTFSSNLINHIIRFNQTYDKKIPIIRKIDNQMVQRNYNQIREEVQEIVNAQIQEMMNDPDLEWLVVRKI